MDSSKIFQVAFKVLASGLLLWLVAVSLFGLYRIWKVSELAYRTFAYTRDGEDDATAGLHFTQLVSYEMRRLHQSLSPPPAAGDAFTVPNINQQGGRVESVSLPRLSTAVLPDIEIQAYGVRFSALANKLIRQVVPPNEVVGTIIEKDGRFDAYVELHQSPASAARALPAAALVAQQTDKTEAAFSTASRIYHMLSAQQGLIYAETSYADFEVFARALQQYQLYQSSVAEVRSSDIAEQSLEMTERLLDDLIGRDSNFPPAYKLSALVAYSKGDVSDAVKLLETYERLWPKGMAADEDAKKLLAAYREDAQRAAKAASGTEGDRNYYRSRHRPVHPGLSVSSPETTAGTLCCIVKDTGESSGPRYLLAPDYLIGTVVGGHVVQPGMHDGGDPETDVIAEVARAIPGVAAIARLTANFDVNSPDFSFSGVATVSIGQKVRKVGRTTGVTGGTVTATDVSMKINYGGSLREFSGLIAVRAENGTSFSLGGDAGAPVVDEENRLIGMQFAGSESISLVMPIEAIMQQLEVELLYQ